MLAPIKISICIWLRSVLYTHGNPISWGLNPQLYNAVENADLGHLPSYYVIWANVPFISNGNFNFIKKNIILFMIIKFGIIVNIILFLIFNRQFWRLWPELQRKMTPKRRSTFSLSYGFVVTHSFLRPDLHCHFKFWTEKGTWLHGLYSIFLLLIKYFWFLFRQFQFQDVFNENHVEDVATLIDRKVGLKLTEIVYACQSWCRSNILSEWAMVFDINIFHIHFQDNVFIISKPKSKYPVLQLDLRFFSRTLHCFLTNYSIPTY